MTPAPNLISFSATPTQGNLLLQDGRPLAGQASRGDGERDGLQPPRLVSDGRSHSNSNAAFGPRGSSLAPSGPPGSFSSDLRSIMSRSGAATPRSDHVGSTIRAEEHSTASEQMVLTLRDKLNKEIKIKEGSENLLEALNMKKAKQTKEQRSRVETELNSSNRKIGELKIQIAELQRPRESETSGRSRLSSLFRGNALRTPPIKSTLEQDDSTDVEQESESPTFVLAEILQALESDGMQADYYVERANSLVELFKRHPNLKFDLAWSVFGLRVQMMLLSDSKEVIAAGYRMTRYAITDRKSLQKIRELNTDYLVILSLVKEGKASVEREQALKFVRAFLDVKDGIDEVSRAIIRTIVSIVEHTDDRLREICIETLAEILVINPSLVVSAGGMGPLIDIVGEGSYNASETLVTAFLYLFDTPARRRYLRSGHELEGVFAVFTDSLSTSGHESRLKASAKVISAILKSWTGLMTVSMYGFQAIRSLIASLRFSGTQIRTVVIELLCDILRVKPPSWSSSFLAGRRLTTYGRVTNMKSEPTSTQPSDERRNQRNLVNHYVALLLAVLFEAGMLEALLCVIEECDDQKVRRKTILLVSEILKMASRFLPAQQSSKLQMLPGLFSLAAKFGADDRSIASNTLYQIDSVSKTLTRSTSVIGAPLTKSSIIEEEEEVHEPARPKEKVPKFNPQMDESSFRTLLVESQVVNHTNYIKWRWDIIESLIEGPLTNPKRLDEAIKVTKFVKRLVGFYRPFKYRFANVKNTKHNQRYVRVGCALVRTLLQNPEGVRYLADNKLLRQIAECLAQFDRTSGITSPNPLFSETRLTETLSGGYFAILGVLSNDAKGLQMIERRKIFNMCYHIIELTERPDLTRALLSNMDFSLDSHFRVILSKALTAGTRDIRIFATNCLRKYAGSQSQPSQSLKSLGNAEWAIRMLVTQLYDPDVEVCETAVRILEEACNRRHYLEYVVKCRPALDHLGEIGAPLLLRFLSTSVGYHYLDGLDYITQEMDDWFLGRNDAYVTIVEASLARAMDENANSPRNADDTEERPVYGDVPPHFYRELTRTAEGCKLLEEKGHFEDFVSTIRDSGMESEDEEVILKVKGCLWAVGNVGSMALGAPFLEHSDVVQQIVSIAENSEIMTMRGTAFFVLGLISRSLHGFEILDECGWDGPTTMMGESLGFCIPLKLDRLFSIKPWKYAPDATAGEANAQLLKEAKQDEDEVNRRVLELIVDLGTTVLTKRSISELVHIKQKKHHGFRQPQLFYKAMTILECYHYRLPVRRFIIDLFDKNVMRLIVLDEEDSSEGDTEMAARKMNTYRFPGAFD